jgi:hypothetical protein
VLADILPHLNGVEKRSNKLWAICPAHPDKNPSLSIKEEDDRVLMHCFGCQANGIEVMKALRLSPSLLFRDPRKNEIPRAVMEKAEEDLFFIEIFENEKRKGSRITYNDLKRYRLAKERVKLLKAS